MTITEQFIVYPEGETQEIFHPLRVNQIVDMNGSPLQAPLASPKIVAYRVYKKSTKENKGSVETFYYLELVPVWELASELGLQ